MIGFCNLSIALYVRKVTNNNNCTVVYLITHVPFLSHEAPGPLSIECFVKHAISEAWRGGWKLLTRFQFRHGGCRLLVVGICFELGKWKMRRNVTRPVLYGDSGPSSDLCLRQTMQVALSRIHLRATMRSCKLRPLFFNTKTR